MAMSRKANGALAAKPVARISESRKVRKPLMEKKRRARINQSLNDLKRLLLESNSVKKEGTRPTKLEKADILELTVTHVQKLHQQQQWGLADVQANDDAHASSKFKAGFSECARLVRELLQAQCRKVEPGLEQRLAEHLDRCLSSLDQALAKQQKSSSGHQHQRCMSSSSRSPSPVSSFNSIHHVRSDSRSSFEGKDTVLLSPQSPPSVHPSFSKSPLPSPASALLTNGGLLLSGTVNGVATTTSNGLVSGAGGAGPALSRTGQRQLWGASSAATTTTATTATKSAFVCQPHADWRGPLTAADLNSEYLTSCPVNANSSNGDLLLGRGKPATGSRIVSPECGAVGVAAAAHSPISTHSATAVDGSRCQLPVARMTSPVARGKASSASSPSASDEDDFGNSSSSSLSQPSSPVSALDLRAQVGRVHLNGSAWQRQVALAQPHESLWTHVGGTNLKEPSASSLTAVAGHLSLIPQQQQLQQLTCSSKLSLDDSRVWRPW